MVILALTPMLLAGCAQEAGLENRIASLETKLTATESTIKVLQGRIEQLEKESLTEADIPGALEGKAFSAVINSLPLNVGTIGYWRTGIVIKSFYNTN
jgi:hypothetical protein